MKYVAAGRTSGLIDRRHVGKAEPVVGLRGVARAESDHKRRVCALETRGRAKSQQRGGGLVVIVTVALVQRAVCERAHAPRVLVDGDPRVDALLLVQDGTRIGKTPVLLGRLVEVHLADTQRRACRGGDEKYRKQHGRHQCELGGPREWSCAGTRRQRAEDQGRDRAQGGGGHKRALQSHQRDDEEAGHQRAGDRPRGVGGVEATCPIAECLATGESLDCERVGGAHGDGRWQHHDEGDRELQREEGSP